MLHVNVFLFLSVPLSRHLLLLVSF
jgi:hypothetical protein